MAENVLIYGKSGSGKSRSLINFKEDEIVLFNTLGKRLPFQKKFKFNQKVDNYEIIKATLKKMPQKVAVIDDATYLLVNDFMENHSKHHTGGEQFQMYNDLADSFYKLMKFSRENVPEDVIVYYMMQEETQDSGDIKPRTIGKLLDSKVILEGLITVSLRCVVKNGKHLFLTQSDGFDVSKSPEGMFEVEIPNDLKFVDDSIRSYWKL